MKCVKCGAEMKEGCVYCSVCGNEAQIVPDYSVLEDDYLRKLLEEENQPEKQTYSDSKKNAESTSVSKKRMSSTIPIIVVCCILLVAIIAGVIIKLNIDHKNANSYDYQVQMAEQEAVDKNYENALQYYKTALALKPGDISVRLAMADIYMDQMNYDSAMVLLIEVIELDKANQQAYQNLIQIYEEKEDYDSIVELASDIKDTDILELFEGYIVAEPVFSPIEGKYEEYVTVTLFSIEEFDIYYTMNGEEPDATYGTLYDEDEGIPLEEAGEYEIKAVCVNEKGICSEVVGAEYEVELLPPEYPTVTPDGGRITSETIITIEAEENCSIYYTWDGTDPTQLSTKYEAPLEIPYGNNVLSVLVVDDETGLDSGVYRTNFIYYP